MEGSCYAQKYQIMPLKRSRPFSSNLPNTKGTVVRAIAKSFFEFCSRNCISPNTPELGSYDRQNPGLELCLN